MARSGPAHGTDVMIHQGRLHWGDREEGAAEGEARPQFAPPSVIDTWRNNLVLVVVFLYLLFNWGFMQLRIPPVAGGGLPIGEIVLLLSLMTINYTSVLGRMSYTVALVPFCIWWVFGVGRALFDFSQHGTWALRDCDLLLPTGGVIALVGPNGAGKTTLLQLAAGLIRPTTGSIALLDDRVPAGSPQALARLGFVAQEHPLYRRFRVRDLLHMGRALNPTWDQELAERRLTDLDIRVEESGGALRLIAAVPGSK